MYEEHYGLKEKPFSLTPDPEFLYLSTSHREAMEHLAYGITQKHGFILITGDVGTGKTTICRAILNRLKENVAIALMLNPFFSEEELLKYILIDFGVSPAGKTKLDLMHELNQLLIKNSSNGITSVLIIDEAQNLSFAILEQIRILSNFETEKEKLLQIVLVGQLDLLKKLELEKLRQLDQRIAIRYQLKHLNGKDTEGYIYHRLSVAGSEGKISFSRYAIREITKFSKGIPRIINLICDRSLLNGYTKQKYIITRRMVLQAVNSLRNEGDSVTIPFVFFRTRMFIVFGIIIFVTGGSCYYGFVKYLESWFSVNQLKEGNKVSLPVSNVPQENSKTTFHCEEYKFDKDFPYSIQIASFNTQEEAVKKIQELKYFVLPVYISKVNLNSGKILYRALIGKFRTKSEAFKVKEILMGKENLQNIWVIEAFSEEARQHEHNP